MGRPKGGKNRSWSKEDVNGKIRMYKKGKIKMYSFS